MSEPTWQFEHSVVANAPREVAWRFWANVDNWARLEGDAVESITLHGPFQTGTLGTTKMPGQEPKQWTLVEVTSPERTVIEMALPDAVFRSQWRFNELSAHRTRITQRMTLSGERAQVYVGTVAPAFESGAPQGMSKLAAAIARSGSADLPSGVAG